MINQSINQSINQLINKSINHQRDYEHEIIIFHRNITMRENKAQIPLIIHHNEKT